jgi:hypothetical protein
VLRTLASERRMGSGMAWLWASYSRIRYLLRLLRP